MTSNYRIEADTNGFRVVKKSNVHYRGGAINALLRNKSYAECEQFMKERYL